MQQDFSPAYGSFGISGSLQKQLLSDLLFRHRFSLHEFFQLLQVFIGIKSDALALTAIAAGSSGFLVISFEAFGNIIMDDIPYVGFVDPHTKSNGSNDHVCFFHQERILIARTLLRIHAGMIRERFDTVCFQDIGKLFHLLTAQTIDNT